VLLSGDGGRQSKHVGGKSNAHIKLLVPPIKCGYVVCMVLIPNGYYFQTVLDSAL
jgi:hypothetical protein